MSARGNLPPAETAQDLVDKHDRLIHSYKQLCKPVECNGLKYLVVGFCWHKGDAETVVYLEGVAG
ncbi:hypothetical protein [Duganella sp. BJB475]|uniref:hypothetical protein n=1 Tax=Duganella sp. BJB475 TaxID=2233914 RepID=UPI000E340A60|nr:hypothetical protein [Duganella sp. BJB475]RFP08993.1 hypothetical protein D0T23_27845 [Duganella sp. BJB475]